MYLEEFKRQIQSRNLNKFLQLWEEYRSNDEADVEEFKELLEMIKYSDFSKQFGKIVESALPLWRTIQDSQDSYRILQLLIDIQNTNSLELGELAFQALKVRHGEDPLFNERLRLVGLRTRDNFQQAISNYELLSHMAPGKFVYHPTGWGAGEIIEVSAVRQQVTIEFENVPGRKHLTFDSAFKSIVPLKNDHFLSRRFANPDQLEKEAREEPITVVKMLLRDLGPKTASEIKDALCTLVIPENDWSKWWQGVRSRLKKDPIIEVPENLNEPFRLRKTEITQEERLSRAIKDKSNIEEIIATTYGLMRDLPDLRKQQDVKQALQDKLLTQLQVASLTPIQELQILICLEEQFGHRIENRSSAELIKQIEDIEAGVQAIEIVALKKRVLSLIKEQRPDWKKLFFKLILNTSHSVLRDYILKELNQKESRKELEQLFEGLLEHPERSPECFLWLIQRINDADDGTLPFASKEGRNAFFESLLILMHRIESNPQHKDIVKKIYNMLSAKRYVLVRKMFEGADIEFVKEVLLLASKCHTLSDHDRSIMSSLAAVVHPQLENKAKKSILNSTLFWTTEEALEKAKARAQQIGTVEIVANAKEIEAARALGDLRENSEYKFAREKRAQLLRQLKTLSDQIQHARIITPHDISTDEVGIGNIVEIEDSHGKKLTYTILGSWEADADKNILSFQSKLAQAMVGYRKGEQFTFRDEEMKVLNIQSFLNK